MLAATVASGKPITEPFHVIAAGVGNWVSDTPSSSRSRKSGLRMSFGSSRTVTVVSPSATRNSNGVRRAGIVRS